MKASSGYTLIEIMIATVILLLVLTSGVVSYAKFDEKQKVINSGREFVNKMRETQKRAQSSEKPEIAPCDNDVNTLVGWRFYMQDSDTYAVQAECGTGTYTPAEMYDLLNGVTFENSFDFTFSAIYAIPNISGSTTLQLKSNDNSFYYVEVNQSGGILDTGYATE